MAAGDHVLRRFRVKTVIEIEAAIVLGFERAGIEMQVQALQIFGGRHDERHVETLEQEARGADMVGMKMRGDDAGQRTVPQHAIDSGCQAACVALSPMPVSISAHPLPSSTK